MNNIGETKSILVLSYSLKNLHNIIYKNYIISLGYRYVNIMYLKYLLKIKTQFYDTYRAPLMLLPFNIFSQFLTDKFTLKWII